ncbi:MAG: (d)CMP kinase [Methyloversatilis sp.]|jgi:cytidylate kinase|uniref:Cytidylate kinase n=1 Tax=Methyloversatilis universalis (strain ATCC BAA-1314 / DSM 25237 / JCM 13912 / CCUG 52030 / FAM5) TaxID=1000565 RepID=F5REK6_METUF|nr:(d)CMP kinase [Methyloversatilis universalis]EGK71337.1 LOW QUALITY PROTEIN: 3-phosphoshikimate 1-carboxyvinyltransferase:Cytidylate kinase [Methyloversatilis universalis FAM5]MCP4637744.1 (d)CMP kinase [Methyloversatilis sp.]
MNGQGGIPVIAIDGPSASGKGTVAARVAAALGFHLLDSGALYRLTAVAAIKAGVALDDEAALTQIAAGLDVRFADGATWLAGEEVSDAMRSEAASVGASKVAVFGGVRAALLGRQRAFRQAPGLVGDGRDMGSVVFPDAALKVFLTASVEIRAERRYKQLIEKGVSANLESLSQDLRERDERDRNRAHAPLVQLPDALLLDTSSMSADAAVRFVLDAWRERNPQ